MHSKQAQSLRTCRFKIRVTRCVLTLGLLFTVPFAFAARPPAPVVDLSKSSQQEVMQTQGGLEVDTDVPTSSSLRSSVTYQNEPAEQRILRLEKQISNLIEMGFASKLEKMQQEVQQLHGQLEVQNHEISQLKEQVRNFYQDLDQRMAKAQSGQSLPPEKKAKSAPPVVKETSSDTEETIEDTSSSNKTQELQSYEVAFNYLNKKEYDKAIKGFQAFVKSYPSSHYSVNAHYWLGEIYYLKNKSDQANKEFQLIISNYPDNPKVADAMIKVGLIAMDAGNYTKAKQTFTKVRKQFPETTAAKIAALRLKEIKNKEK